MIKEFHMRKVIFIILTIVILGAIGGYFYLYKDHRNIEQEEASVRITSKDLVTEFSNSQDSANLKYLNQVIEIQGKVTEVSDSTLVLDSLVFCSFDKKIDSGIQGKEISVKGRCIGFDELFGEVKFDQCNVIK